MEKITCTNCGSNEFEIKAGLRICRYCGTSFQLSQSEVPRKSSIIALNDDIARLLEKCKREPSRARKYANLILDIDPTNIEARKYL